MNAALLFGPSGPLVILTSYDSFEHPALLNRLAAKGISKFIAFKLDVNFLRTRYGPHFDIVCEDLHESDDLRVLDFDGARTFKLIPFSELGGSVMHEPAEMAV